MTVGVIVWLLRHELGALLEAPVKRWKAGPVEVEYWQQTAVEVAESVASAAGPASPVLYRHQVGKEGSIENATALKVLPGKLVGVEGRSSILLSQCSVPSPGRA